MNHTAAILAAHDAGNDAQQIADALPVSLGYVYGVLRKARPTRPRKARTATSDTPRMVRGLAAQGIVVERIAVLCGVSKQYCYRILADAAAEVVT
jgi:uncharacterized protein YggE